MPLLEGTDQGTMGANIAELRNSGYPENQAIAIAMRKAGVPRRKAKRAKGAVPSKLTVPGKE